MRAATVGERRLVLAVCLDQRAERHANDVHTPASLTAREREIVALIALGRVTAEICGEPRRCSSAGRSERPTRDPALYRPAWPPAPRRAVFVL